MSMERSLKKKHNCAYFSLKTSFVQELRLFEMKEILKKNWKMVRYAQNDHQFVKKNTGYSISWIYLLKEM